MKLGPGIRIALAAATLLAQLALPIGHGFGSASERADYSIGSAAAAAVTADESTTPAHDPSQCPACLALSQSRTGVGRVLAHAFFAVTSSSAASPLEPGIVLPRAPELAAAPPRAPPVPALFFA